MYFKRLALVANGERVRSAHRAAADGTGYARVERLQAGRDIHPVDQHLRGPGVDVDDDQVLEVTRLPRAVLETRFADGDGVDLGCRDGAKRPRCYVPALQARADSNQS